MIYAILILGSIGFTIAALDIVLTEKDIYIPHEIGVFGVVLFLIACLLGAGLTGYHKALYDIEHKNEPQSVEKVMGGK